MKPAETVTVDSDKTWCDGSSEDAGHPRVFLTLKNGAITCPYCSRRFVLAKGKKTGTGH